jgi:hypothetical protein
MMHEIKNVQRHKGEPKRRWFFDPDMDLTVWVDEKEMDSKTGKFVYKKILSYS